MTSFLEKVAENLPEVSKPSQKKLSFKEKAKWTLIILVLFFVLGLVPLYGLGHNALQQFEYLSMILGAKFGSIISLGIGPIVTASIVLQLLTGSGILKFDLTTIEGKKKFQGLQKILALTFIVFEGAIYVFMGGLSPDPLLAGTALYFQLQLLIILQLILGGILILFMDEVISKWGFSSGISLFIAAGVSETIFIGLLSPLSPTGSESAAGAIPAMIQNIVAGNPTGAALMLSIIVATALVFIAAVYMQSMRVEIPLSFGRVRGQGIRWPLQFVYTSNIPVILVAALLANVQLLAHLLQNAGRPILGTFIGNQPDSGFVAWIFPPNLIEKIITQTLTIMDVAHSFVYILFMVIGCVIFSWFWVQTAGMDSKAQAKHMVAAGLQIPGFRRDERILEKLLDRYILPLTIMGAISVGLLAALADLTGAVGTGTGILLTVMIVYKLYEEIAQQHMMDMNPMMRKFMGGE